MKVVIAGGTGAIGRRVADDAAARGDEVVILTRTRRPGIAHRQVQWDGRTVGAWASVLDGAVLFDLAGELVERRPTRRNVELLRRSRVEPTQALARAAEALANPLPLWVQMSTLAIYGDAGQRVVEEGHPVADGPPQMPGVARPWEDAARDVRTERQIVLRTGIVLDRGAPAFERLTRLTTLGLGGRVGPGDQWVSWIHIDDVLAAFRFLSGEPSLHGIVHVTSPNPIRNRHMMATFRSALHRPWSPPTPRPLVHVGALLMGSDPALALTGRRCMPRRLLDAGFTFAHPTLDAAVSALVAPGATQEPPAPVSAPDGRGR
jgi:uncharacterized protein (TIGR01777 family)